MNRKNIYYWLLLPVLALMMGACGESSNNEDPAKPDTPVTPVEEEWQTVPASGGTIKKGDIALTFPAGTFSSDTKVAITEVKKGDVLGEDEASPFYQVTMPVDTREPITIRIKCDKTDDDIYVITNIPSIGKHTFDEVTVTPLSCETVYSNGEYIATLPASTNKGVDENISIAVGLGHRFVFSNSSDISSSRKTRSIEGEKEGNISWYFETDRNFETQYTAELSKTLDNINSYIHQAIKQIDALGFKLLIPKRRIPITLFDKTEETAGLWGKFEQHYSNDTKSWFSIRKDMLTNPNVDQQEVKATIFHELLHYFQADYDQRYPILKYRNVKGDELLMYEAGGQWIEKFVYGHVYISEAKYRLKSFVKGLNDIEAIYPGVDIGTARQNHGYAMAALWEYIAQEFDDNIIVKIYDEWSSNVEGWGFKCQSTYVTLMKFATKNNFDLFSGGYESFLNMCAEGEMVPGFSLQHFDEEFKRLTTSVTSLEFEGVSYAHGVDTKRLWIIWDSKESLKEKEIVIKQETDNMNTYAYTQKDGKYKCFWEKRYYSTDSLIISGEELEKMRVGDKIDTEIWLLNIRYVGPLEPVPYKIKVELRDVMKELKATPTELNFKAEGGTETVKVEAKGYKYYGGLEGNCDEWITIKNDQQGSFTVTAAANNTTKERTDTIYAYGTNSESPTAADLKLLPIKVTQEAGNGGNEGNEGNEGKEGWWLVETKIDKAEDTTNNNGHFIDYMNYTASETGQSMTGMQTGLKGYEYVQQPVSFVSTIQAPPAWIGGGETLLLHFTVKRTSPAAYCYVPVGPVMYLGNAQVAKINVVGGTSVATRENDASEGEWDFELQISKGSKNSQREIKLVDACRSTIHWIYRWGNSSKKE